MISRLLHALDSWLMRSTDLLPTVVGVELGIDHEGMTGEEWDRHGRELFASLEHSSPATVPRGL